MPNAFGRFFMKVLTYTLKAIGVLHNLLALFQSFLGNRYQRVLFNGQNYQQELIQARVELDFNKNIDEKIPKARKVISVIKKLSYILPRNAILTIYRSFVGSHLDYSNITYDQPINQSFSNKIKVIVCSYHVTYTLQSECTLYSCLNVKERLAAGTKSEV